MELVNAIAKYIDGGNVDGAYLEDVMKNLLLLLAPFAPHFCEELWEQAGRPFSIFNQSWPQYDEAKTHKQEVEYGIQVNGKIRARILLAADLSKEEVEAAALAEPAIANAIEGKSVRKIIVVRNIVNIVVG